MENPRPIDKARIGRIVLACLDQDRDKAEAAFNEALTEGTVPELFDTLLGAHIGMMRLTIGDDNIRQWASDWILHGHNEDEST